MGGGKTRRPRYVSKKAPVSLGGVTREEELPFPVVHYPNHYGAFIAFAPDEDTDPSYCACARSALENLARLNSEYPLGGNMNPLREAPLDSFHVPDESAQASMQEPDDPLQAVAFEGGLCHRCNMTPPSWRWCHEMYGGKFRQSFGWYIQQASLRLGIRPLHFDFLPDVCPNEFAELILKLRAARDAYHQERDRVMEIVEGPRRSDIGSNEVTYWRNLREEEARPMLKLKKEHGRLARTLKNSIENVAREEFGFRKVGKGWVSETLLFQLVKRILRGRTVIHHHRPDWLDGLELDIWVPELELALEYQGQQHFYPVEAWGGKGALKALQSRDQKKRETCNRVGVTLVEVDYTEPLTLSHVRDRLTDVRVPLEDG